MKHLFFHSDLLKTKKRAWMAPSLYFFAILVTSPVVPTFSQWLRHHNLLRISLLGMLFLFLGYIFAYFIGRLEIRNIKAYLWIGLFLVLISLLMLENKALEERVHFLEYAFLALLLFKAAKFSFKGARMFVIPLLLTVALGWMDELWQGLLPNRFYDIWDVFDNAVGGFLGIGFAWIRQKYGKK